MKSVVCILMDSDICEYMFTMQCLNGFSMIYLASLKKFAMTLLCSKFHILLQILNHNCCYWCFGVILPHGRYHLLYNVDFSSVQMILAFYKSRIAGIICLKRLTITIFFLRIDDVDYTQGKRSLYFISDIGDLVQRCGRKKPLLYFWYVLFNICFPIKHSNIILYYMFIHIY